MILLLVFIPFFLYYLRERTVLTFLFTLIIISLIGTLFLGREVQDMNIKDVFMLSITAILLLLIILPWKNYKNINSITTDNINDNKIKTLTKWLVIINSFTFIILLITTIIVQKHVDNISIFKYGEDVSLEFYSTMLPFSRKYLTLSILIYGFSYFMLPLHFYYLSIHKYKLSLVCLLLSFNIILKGTTYFSRYVIIEYVFLYFSLYLMLRNIFPNSVKTIIKKTAYIGLVLFSALFITISIDRFGNDSTYNYEIPSSSPIKDPVLYSLVDYLSQWYFNGAEVLHDYNLETFKGNITLSTIYELLNHFNIISYDYADYRSLRIKLWKDNWYTFTGFSAYTIYDYGIIGGIFLCVLYFLIVKKKGPKNDVIYINDLFLISLLIQIPLMSIFYSQIGALFFPIIFYLIINFYLRFQR